MKYIKNFSEISMADVAQVGGKNASLGEMIRGLKDKKIRIPQGFAITAAGYWRFMDYNNLRSTIDALLSGSGNSLEHIEKISREIRRKIVDGSMPADLADEITHAYQELSKLHATRACDVAIRSSATAEDLPGASFAGQQETYLHIQGVHKVLESCKKCFASLFTPRAIVYRHQKGFDQLTIALSIGIQKMVRSDLACSGVLFTLDPETGFKDAAVINASYGLGESIVQGEVTPDEFVVFKPKLMQGYAPIIKKQLGTKIKKAVYHTSKSTTIAYKKVPISQQQQFCLTDSDILELARMGTEIESYYGKKKNGWSPMDIEWAKDGKDGHLYIVQARPETVHSKHPHITTLIEYQLKKTKSLQVIATGLSVGRSIVSGTVKYIKNPKQSDEIKEGDILVTQMTNPDWVPVMKKAAGIVTMQGGRTCHAAIVSRELGIPAIIGVSNALHLLKQHEKITLDCSQGDRGYIYQGIVPFKISKTPIKNMPKIPAQLLVNIADPATAFTTSFLPVDGVGLARIEFIISNSIKIHPLALLYPHKITDKKSKKIIREIVAPYLNDKEFYVEILAQGIGMLAAAFYPKPVIVRTSDFKTNEYRDLVGGSYFEPKEENPMLGFRGAARYIHPNYQEAFELECKALKKVYDAMGLTNIIPMIPFVRSVHEAEKVVKIMRKYLKSTIPLFMMCETPANVILMEEFSNHFDGFSIGSNDLTQLTLGVDRDSALVANLFDERNPAALTMFEQAINGAHHKGKKIGICGQAPSDYPQLGKWLIERGIDSLSLNQDTILSFLANYKKL